MKKLLLVFVCSTFLFSCDKEKKKSTSPETEQIKKELTKQRDLFDAPGIAFGLIKNEIGRASCRERV